MSNEIFVGNWSKRRQLFANEAPADGVAAKKPAKYTKPPCLVEFENEYNAHKYDNKQMIPPECRVRTRFSDNTANALTTAIIAHLEYNGHFAARVNTTGIYDERRGLYRQTNARRGMADISAIINGKSVQLEIKAGKDKPRTDQIQVQNEVRKAGGIYEFVHTFSQYLEIYKTLTATKPP